MNRTRLIISKPGLITGIIMLVLCGLPAVFLNNLFGWFALLFLLFMGGFCLFSALYASRNIKIRGLSQTSSCIRGEEVELALTIENAGRLPCTSCCAHFVTTDIYGKARSESDIDFTLAPKESRTFHFTVSFDHVGSYAFCLNSFRTGGPLGVISVEQQIDQRNDVFVTPKIHNMSSLPFSKETYVENQVARVRSRAESIDFSGVREYALGDPMKLIHWKLSSHAGNYVTKILESYGNHGLTVFPGFSIPETDTETAMELLDAIVESCSSVCVEAGFRGMDVKLAFRDKNGRNCYQIPDHDFYAFIHEIPPISQEKSRWDMLETEMTSMYGNSNIMVCTAVLDPDVVQNLLMLSQTGRTLIVFYIRPKQFRDNDREGDKALRTLQGAGVSCFVIPSADEIERSVA